MVMLFVCRFILIVEVNNITTSSSLYQVKLIKPFIKNLNHATGEPLHSYKKL